MALVSHADAARWKPKTVILTLDGAIGRAKGHVTTAAADSDTFDGDYR